MTGVKNPKITILIPDFAFGGPERVMITVANGLTRRGCYINFLNVGRLRDAIQQMTKKSYDGVAPRRRVAN